MSDFPPPTPNPSKQMRGVSQWVLPILLVVVAVAVFVGTRGNDEGSTPPSTKPSGTYSWKAGTCDEWGFEGTFTNKSDVTSTFELFAEVFDDQGNQVDRDSEFVFDLGPGQSETVEFIFTADTYSTCRFTRAEVRG